MLDDVEFRVGDVLTVSCRFARSRVESLKWGTLELVWPWWERDPDSELARWNGVVGLGIDANTFQWHELELFRTEPAPEPLTLLTRADVPCAPETAAAVARHTRNGNHQQVLERWTHLTDATPTRLGGVVPRLQ